MKKKVFTMKIVLFTMILSVNSCTPQYSVDYAASLKDCLTSNDVELLNKACQTFEMKLLNKYKGQELGNAYKKYLQDIQAMNILPSYFVSSDSKKILQEFKNSKLFDKVWTKVSSLEDYQDIEIVTTDSLETDPEQENDSYCMNPNGEYLNCLIKQNQNKTILDYLEAIKATPDISPGLTAGIVHKNLTEEDFNDGLTRLIIAVGFYYEIGIIFEKE